MLERFSHTMSISFKTQHRVNLKGQHQPKKTVKQTSLQHIICIQETNPRWTTTALGNKNLNKLTKHDWQAIVLLLRVAVSKPSLKQWIHVQHKTNSITLSTYDNQTMKSLFSHVSVAVCSSRRPHGRWMQETCYSPTWWRKKWQNQFWIKQMVQKKIQHKKKMY